MKHEKSMSRRKFLGSSISGLVGAGIVGSSQAHLSAEDTDMNAKVKDYRVLGRTGFKTSDIAFGAGMLTSPQILESALDLGINYIDTGEHYMNGMSEKAIGEVIKTRKRKSLFITTKLNLNFGGKATKQNIKNRFYKCLERLKTDYVDCLMMHMAKDIDQVKHNAFHQAVSELKSEEKLLFCGISNHGPKQSIYGKMEVPMEQVLLAAAEDGRFDVMLLVYNFLQKEQGEKIISACNQKNIGVSLMKTNPVKVYNRWKGGLERRQKQGLTLTDKLIKLDRDYKKYLERAEFFKKKHQLSNDNMIRESAIKFVLTNTKVHNVCLSIGNFDELNNFIKLSGKKMERKDLAILDDYENMLGKYYCRHACGKCEFVCKKAVPVNTIMRYHHYYLAQGREKHSMERYRALGNQNAENCMECMGECQNICPYQIPVQQLLIDAHHTLTLT